MQEGIVIQNQNLPDKIEDLAKFVLVGREKLTSVRAEIRAIDKVQLAQEVREQKKEEAQMLAEALLDAEVKIGDLLKQIPTANGRRTDLTSSHQCDKVKSKEVNSHQCEDNKKTETKQEVITRLGFNKDQASRFETLSSNKEIVEQVKAEARENEDIPTRTRVLQLVKQKSKEEQFLEEEFKKIENKKAIELNYHNALFKILTLEIKDTEVYLWVDSMMKSDKDRLEQDIDEAIDKLTEIKEIYRNYNQIRRIK